MRPYSSRVASAGDELGGARAERAVACGEDQAQAQESDRLRGQLRALSTQLEGAGASIENAAAQHQEELERLQRELEGSKYALVALKGSVSWRVTRPLRALRRMLP